MTNTYNISDDSYVREYLFAYVYVVMFLNVCLGVSDCNYCVFVLFACLIGCFLYPKCFFLYRMVSIYMLNEIFLDVNLPFIA